VTKLDRVGEMVRLGIYSRDTKAIAVEIARLDLARAKKRRCHGQDSGAGAEIETAPLVATPRFVRQQPEAPRSGSMPSGAECHSGRKNEDLTSWKSRPLIFL
jgi:hypothetical protein